MRSSQTAADLPKKDQVYFFARENGSLLIPNDELCKWQLIVKVFLFYVEDLKAQQILIRNIRRFSDVSDDIKHLY